MPAISSALDRLLVQVQPVQPARTTKPVTLAAVPKRLGAIRDAVASRGGPHERFAAKLLGWLDGQPVQVTAAGQALLATAPDSDEESFGFAMALLENPPLSAITSELLLGEWLELRDLAPELARVLGLSAARAQWLVPGLLAWRDELRTRGWTPRRIAEHLRARTEWMDGLSIRGRDVLARLGVVTRERVLALDVAKLRGSTRYRPETVGEIARFCLQLRRAASFQQPTRRVTSVRPPAKPRDVTRSVSAIARNLLVRRGCASIAALGRECGALEGPELELAALRRILDAQPDIHWLDRDTGWFWAPTLPDNPLVACVDALLAECGDMDVLDLRTALARDPRIDRDAPPPPVLAALCEQIELCELLDDDTRVRDTRRSCAPEPIIDETTTIGELARLANMTLEDVVALAMGEPRATGERKSRRSR